MPNSASVTEAATVSSVQAAIKHLKHAQDATDQAVLVLWPLHGFGGHWIVIRDLRMQLKTARRRLKTAFKQARKAEGD